jgi:hypothetical protein
MFNPNELMLKERYGVAPAPESAENLVHAAKILLIVAGEDGEVSQAQIDYLKGLARALGAPDDLITQVSTFDYRGADLEGHVGSIVSATAASHRIVYEAVRMARSDADYEERQRAFVARVGARLKVNPLVVKTIEGLVDMEITLQKMRAAVLAAPR